VRGVGLVPYREGFLEISALDEQDDLALIRAFQGGEINAMSVLLKRRRAWLYSIAKRTVSNVHIAEDGLQEAHIQILKGAKDFRGDSQVTTWMYKIVVRCCIDVMRKENVRQADALPEDSDSLVGSTSGFEAKVVDTLFIHGALAELDSAHREIVDLIRLKGLSHEEVSEYLHIPIGTVKSRVSRAESRLKEVIKEILLESGNQSTTSSVKELEVTNVRNFRRRA
jgi:RNA polymerase sigma-70 factor (ECF subfamily)